MTSTSDDKQTIEALKDLKEGKNVGAAEQLSPADMAAAFYSLEQPRLKILVDDMSLRQIRRLFWNLVSYPFIKPENSLIDEVEKKAFYIAEQMMSNKAIMQLSLEMEKAEKAMAEQDKNSKEVEVQQLTLNKGEN